MPVEDQRSSVPSQTVSSGSGGSGHHGLRSYVVFSGTGPILVLTTYPSLTDRRLVAKLAQKGIQKFIAYEVSVDHVRSVYGVPFEIIAGDLEDVEDLRVLDFNGHHIFSQFPFSEFGEPIKVGEPDASES